MHFNIFQNSDYVCDARRDCLPVDLKTENGSVGKWRGFNGGLGVVGSVVVLLMGCFF